MAPEQHSSWAKLLALALLLAAIGNGAGAYLKRIGVLDREAYKAFWAVRCAIPDRAEQRPCLVYTTPAEIAARAAQPPMDAADAAYRHVYRPGPVERVLKLAKDAFWLLLLATAAWTFAAARGGPPGPRRAAPLLLFALDALAALLVSLPVNGVLVALAGARGMLFLPLALAGRGLVHHIGVFALGASALLVVQAALVPFELWRGLHIFHEWSPWDLARRAAGTLVQPNSLGVFTVCALAFHFCFAPRRAGFAWLLALGGVLVVASASGTGMVCAALGGAALL
uniref:hypothetical protein n=1 Tax=Ramlibacter sp. TaxID=1917967 RepID=UPI0017BBD573